ncbi:ROK family protein [Hazenella coriacea]|uniref:ROK family protein n=1 Tax=Hazenella coriacea TaxID=1179467 RepID=A0A4R3L9C6_9BACL|nr:ROK family protein [Hazenella coriacea]
MGAGVGVNHLVCVTLGTGVGGGLISEGKLIRGMNGFAGEIGHIQIDPQGRVCNCGQVGCLETFSSASAIVHRAQECMTMGRSILLDRDKQLTAQQIFELATQKDELALHVIQPAIEALARVFATLSVVLNPALFIVGGGVSKAGDSLFLPLREKYAEYTQNSVQKDVRIIPAELGSRAGFVGAARLIAQQEN